MSSKLKLIGPHERPYVSRTSYPLFRQLKFGRRPIFGGGRNVQDMCVNRPLCNLETTVPPTCSPTSVPNLSTSWQTIAVEADFERPLCSWPRVETRRRLVSRNSCQLSRELRSGSKIEKLSSKLGKPPEIEPPRWKKLRGKYARYSQSYRILICT